MFNNISNPKWFGDWSRLEDEYLDNNFTEIQDNFAFSKRKKTNGLFGAIVSLATAFPVRDPETGHATGAWKVACESIDLDEVPLSDIADMISCFGSKTITDFRLYNRKVDITPWQQALGELLLRGRVQKDDYPWIQCPNSGSALNMMNMVMGANLPKDFFDDCTLGDEEYGCGEEAHEMASGRKVLNGDIVAVGFDPETGESRSLTDGELSRVEGYFTVISEPGSGEKAVDAIRHGMEPCGYDISVETHDMASGKDALLADAPQRDAPAKDTQNIG